MSQSERDINAFKHVDQMTVKNNQLHKRRPCPSQT